MGVEKRVPREHGNLRFEHFRNQVPHFPCRRVKILSWKLSVKMTTFPPLPYFITFLMLRRRKNRNHQTVPFQHTLAPQQLTDETFVPFGSRILYIGQVLSLAGRATQLPPLGGGRLAFLSTLGVVRIVI